VIQELDWGHSPTGRLGGRPDGSVGGAVDELGRVGGRNAQRAEVGAQRDAVRQRRVQVRDGGLRGFRVWQDHARVVRKETGQKRFDRITLE
jgi:hypothetical protein